MEPKELEQLQNQLQEFSKENARLTQALDDATKSIDAFAAKVEELEKENADLSNQLFETLEISSALSAEIEKLSATPAKEKVEEKPIVLAEHNFELDGKKYGFNYPKLSTKDGVITPLEVKASEILQKFLIDQNHSMIKEM